MGGYTNAVMNKTTMLICSRCGNGYLIVPNEILKEPGGRMDTGICSVCLEAHDDMFCELMALYAYNAGD